MKKKNRFVKKITKVVIVIGAEVLLFGACLIMIYARGTGADNNNGLNQQSTFTETSEAEKLSSLQAGTNQDKNLTSPGGSSSETQASASVSAQTTVDDSLEISTDAMTETEDKELPMEIQLEVTAISQLPELPTGCEVTSLTMALNFEGFDVDKEDLADNYLIKGRPGVNSYTEAFLGNPRSEESYGCFAPVIVQTANKYLKEKNSDKKAYDLTGTDFQDLYKELGHGNPVIVWGSMDINEDIVETDSWVIDGETIVWPGNEHCMVLSGYNQYDDTVTVCDPLREVEIYDRSTFEEHYNQMFQMAVVIK